MRENLRQTLYVRLRLGEFDPPSMNPYKDVNMSEIQNPAHQELSIVAAAKSYVLLKNDEQVLPIRDVQKKIAVSGSLWHISSVFETQLKSCRSSCLESEIINIKSKKNQQKVPGPPPKLSASRQADLRKFATLYITWWYSLRRVNSLSLSDTYDWLN